jgi:hypothetical protein
MVKNAKCGDFWTHMNYLHFLDKIRISHSYSYLIPGSIIWQEINWLAEMKNCEHP